MKIALIGYGKVGRAIEHLAIEKGIEVVARIDHKSDDPKMRVVTPQNIAEADVCIDFTHYETVLDTIETVMKCKKPLVIGTTGWYNQLENARLFCQQYQGRIIYGQNFSLGLNLFAQVLEKACKMISMFPEYDVGGYEIHHAEKCDSPSGTAQHLSEIIIENFESKDHVIYDRFHGQIPSDALHFASLRFGYTPGIHTISFCSPFDTITFTHEAQSRDGWARGALYAANWLLGREPGFYHTKDLIAEIKPGVLK